MLSEEGAERQRFVFETQEVRIPTKNHLMPGNIRKPIPALKTGLVAPFNSKGVSNTCGETVLVRDVLVFKCSNI